MIVQDIPAHEFTRKVTVGEKTVFTSFCHTEILICRRPELVLLRYPEEFILQPRQVYLFVASFVGDRQDSVMVMGKDAYVMILVRRRLPSLGDGQVSVHPLVLNYECFFFHGLVSFPELLGAVREEGLPVLVVPRK